MIRTSFFLAVVLFGCSSTERDPLAPIDAGTTAKAAVRIVANAGAQRIVVATFTTGSNGLVCKSEEVAGCYLSTCNKADPNPGVVFDPGKLSVSSPSLGSLDLPLMNGVGTIVQARDFAPGENVRLLATGSGDMKAFDLTVSVPSPVQIHAIGNCSLDSSSAPIGAPCTLSDASPIVAWTGASDGKIGVGVFDERDAPDRKGIACVFDGAPGKGRIPGEALAKLPRGRTLSTSFQALGASAVSPSGDVALYSSRAANFEVPAVVTLAE